MNRSKLLVTGMIVALTAGTSVVVAQERGQERGAPAERAAPGGGGRQPSAMPQHQGGGANAPGARSEGSRSETTGQAPREDRLDRQGGRNQERGRVEQGGRPEQGQQERNERNRTTGQAPREEQNRPGERGRAEQGRRPEQGQQQLNERNRTTGQAPREEQNRSQTQREERTNRSSEQNRLEQRGNRSEQERGNRSEQQRGSSERIEENRTTTGQGAAGTRPGVNVELTQEKRTRIHDVIVNERSAPRVSSTDFNVSVGTRVPRTVHFVALPPRIVEIEPEWRGFDYFLVGDRMVIIDPRTMEIVAVVDI